ncbi:MAG: cupin domain-containing protein [Porticoccaceae bacterium]
MSSFPVLGDITAQQFLAEYWQKKPLLIRNALPNFQPPVDGNDLAGLALEPDVESRLVVGSNWQIEHGPFEEQRFQSLPERDWTLLVQAVDLWIPEVADILDHFGFLPRWRIDDIMVSYAADGGNVGPHYDNYDVFLLQGQGQRQWSVGHLCDQNSALLPHPNLRILADEPSNQQWTLNCGDMLYLPPKYSHHGVAIGECTTYSIGFRAPTVTEMLDDLTTEIMSKGNNIDTFKDPLLTPDMAMRPISSAYLEQIKILLNKTLDDDELLLNWFAQFMTQPKYPDLVNETAEQRQATISVAKDTYKNYLNGELE